jgi:hypothetical protein
MQPPMWRRKDGALRRPRRQCGVRLIEACVLDGFYWHERVVGEGRDFGLRWPASARHRLFADGVGLSEVMSCPKAPSTLRFAGAVHDAFIGTSGWCEEAAIVVVRIFRRSSRCLPRSAAPDRPVLGHGLLDQPALGCSRTSLSAMFPPFLVGTPLSRFGWSLSSCFGPGIGM